MKKCFSAVVALSFVLCGCRSTYLLSNVESGEVGGGTELARRYRIASCSVVRIDDRGWFWDSKLRTVVIQKDEANVLPELAAMYPGVFSEAKDAVPVNVSVRVRGCDKDGMKAQCDVTVCNAADGKPLGGETLYIESRDMDEEELVGLHGMQTCREIHVDKAYKKTVVEGFAGAVAAALERSENGGVRKKSTSPAPRYVLPVAPIERPF